MPADLHDLCCSLDRDPLRRTLQIHGHAQHGSENDYLTTFCSATRPRQEGLTVVAVMPHNSMPARWRCDHLLNLELSQHTVLTDYQYCICVFVFTR